MSKNIDLAKNWLINSGIQNLEGEHKGAFNSWFDINTKKYPYAYSEITGYGITTLLFMYQLNKENVFLERAKMAADWIMNKATHKSGGILTRYFYEETEFMGSFENEEIFLFDCGMVLNGMVSLYDTTKDKKYLIFCKRLADFILNKQKPDGGFYAVYNGKNNSLIDNGEKWSTQSGALHNKLAIGLLKLHQITKEEKYKESAINACENNKKFFKNDGRVVNFSKTGNSLFHPHCYAIEGLYAAGNYLNNKEYLELAKKATKYLFTIQKENGGIPQMFKDGKLVEFERSDILGQTLRAGILFSIEKIKLEKLKNRLFEFQNLEGEQKGGFKYGFDDSGKKYDHLNSWCTMFALQAMILLENKVNFDGFLIV